MHLFIRRPKTLGFALVIATALPFSLCLGTLSSPLYAQAAPAPAAALTPLPADSATFGFYAGETKDQIVAAIGQAAILKTEGDILEVNAAPKPDPNFDTFLLIVSPKEGLVKLIASGKNIDGDATGKLIKAQFEAMKDGLAKSYGQPGDVFDFINAKSTLKKPNEFMMALTKTDRSLACYWTKKDFGNKITSISLEGNGLGDDTGYLSLEYEFSNYHDYLATKK